MCGGGCIKVSECLFFPGSVEEDLYKKKIEEREIDTEIERQRDRQMIETDFL